MRGKLGVLAVACALVVLGIASGWYAARQGGGGDGEAAHAPGPHAPVLSPQALRNLGVTVGPAETSTFVRHAKVQATVVDAPLNVVPVTAPLGGIVTALHAAPGEVVAAGDPVVSVTRSPIPRPRLALTAELLAPVSERLHETIAQLRMAAARQAIVRKEIARVRGFAGEEAEVPILPGKVLIDLEYDLARLEQEKLNAERELERHGLSPAEIAAVQEGAAPPGNQRIWKQALEENALWGEVEEAILRTLPEAQRARPWSIAAIGELSAAGLAGPELAESLAAHPHLAEHFVEVASLLLEGNTVEKARLLAASGALEPVMVLAAPGAAPDWDVAEVTVRPGQQVVAGAAVARLHDPREMWVRMEPVGAELGAVVRAFEAHTALTARPLLDGTGPDLEGLEVYRLETRGEEAQRGALAILRARNEAIPGPQGARSWRLRVGLRYLVLVPVEVLEDRFVLPADAVTTIGPEQVVFVQDGDTFRPQPVHVEYEDDEVAVIADDGALFPGDPVARTGAFALGLALQVGGGPAADPHAGHSHG